MEPRNTLAVIHVVLAAALNLAALTTLVMAVTDGRGRPELPAPSWAAHLQRVESALGLRDVSAAERAWHEAYGAALRERQWEGLLAVGDASLRVGQVAGWAEGSRPRARQLYLAALFRARSQRSPEGTVQVAEAFAALGDREVAQMSARVTESLLADAPPGPARHRLRLLRQRLVTGVGAGDAAAGLAF